MSLRRPYAAAAFAAALCCVQPHAHARGEGDELAEEPAPQVGQGQAPKTLAERIPSVTHRAFLKRHRVELFPAIGLSLSDPFYRYVMPGIGLNYYFTETMALGLAGDYYGAVQTPVPIAGGTDASQPEMFNRPTFGARLQFSWLPLYGKISWLAESVLHFDTYLAVAGGMLGLKAGGTVFSGSAAIGQHYFVNDWVALRLEIRDEFYQVARDPQVGGKSLQSLLSASLGVCFYLPQEAEPEEL